MLPDFIKQVYALILAHGWLALSALVIGGIIRVLKSDTPLPTLPPKYRAYAALVFGLASGVVQAIMGGTPWLLALLQGLGAGGAAIVGHQVLIEGARDGKELFTKSPTATAVSAAKIAGSIILIAFAAFLCGCSGSIRNGVVASVNAAADFGTGAEKVLADLDRTEQQACVDENSAPETRRACALAVRARFHTAWSAYREYKLAWVASAATVHAYDAGMAAARAPDVVALLKAAGSLADAAEKLRAAVDGLRALVAPPGSANAEKIGGLS